MRYLSTGLFLATCAVLCACAPLAQREQLSQRQWELVATTLESDGTADALVAAALVRRVTLADSAGAMADLDRALQLVPEQPDAAWLALNFCNDTPDCSRAQRGAQLRALDPRNAAASYAALTDARSNADEMAEDVALATMADAAYFDLYWSRLLTRTADALAQPRGPAQRPLRELPLASIEITGWLAAVAIPPFSATGSSCKDDRLKRDDVVAWCRKLAEVLANGDTYIAQMVGLGIAARVWTPGSPELARFQQRKREYSYVQKQTQQYNDMAHLTAEEAGRMIDRYRANRNEHDVYRAWLIELGIPPDPPADWRSEYDTPPTARRIAIQ